MPGVSLPYFKEIPSFTGGWVNKGMINGKSDELRAISMVVWELCNRSLPRHGGNGWLARLLGRYESLTGP